MVRIAPLWFFPIIVSISKSPNLSFCSTIEGRWSISTLLGINPLPAFLEPRFEYFRPCLLRYLWRSPPCRLSFHIQQYIVSWDTIAIFSTWLLPTICSGLKSFRRSFFTRFFIACVNTSFRFFSTLRLSAFLWARSGLYFPLRISQLRFISL